MFGMKKFNHDSSLTLKSLRCFAFFFSTSIERSERPSDCRTANFSNFHLEWKAFFLSKSSSLFPSTAAPLCEHWKVSHGSPRGVKERVGEGKKSLRICVSGKVMFNSSPLSSYCSVSWGPRGLPFPRPPHLFRVDSLNLHFISPGEITSLLCPRRQKRERQKIKANNCEKLFIGILLLSLFAPTPYNPY